MKSFLKTIIILLILFNYSQARHNDTTLDPKNCSAEGCCFQICNKYSQTGPYDAFVYLVFGPVCIIFGFGLFIITLFSKELRKPPGDLIGAILFSEGVLGISWFLMGLESEYIYGSLNKAPCPSTLCKIIARINTVGSSMDTFYNVSLLCYLFVTSKYALTPKKVPHFVFHIIPLIITGVLAGVLVPGLNIYGNCTFIPPFWGVILEILFIPCYFYFACFVIKFVEKSLPNTKELSLFREKFSSFFKRYIYACLLIWTSFIFSKAILLAASRKTIGSSCDASFALYIYGILKIYNTLNMLTPLILSVLRLTDPFFIKQLSEFLNIKTYIYKNDFCQNATPINTVNEYQIELQIGYTISILTSILKEKQQSKTFLKKFIEIDGSGDFKEEKEFDLEESLECREAIATYKKTIFQTPDFHFLQNENREDGIDCLLKIYAPKVFENIMLLDEIDFNIEDSLNVIKNQANIKKSAGASGDGGASGEFFFSSYDNRLIIKTAKEKEKISFLNVLQNYYNYIIYHPNTKITKIYGVYTLIGKQSGTELTIFLMKNLMHVDRCLVTRIYDLKGSSYMRQVHKGKKKDSLGKTSMDLSNKVMKDKDFFTL